MTIHPRRAARLGLHMSQAGSRFDFLPGGRHSNVPNVSNDILESAPPRTVRKDVLPEPGVVGGPQVFEHDCALERCGLTKPFFVLFERVD